MEVDENGILSFDHKAPESYPAELNDFYFELEPGSFWFQHRNNVIEAIIKRYPFKKNFADVGAGNGFQSYHLQKIIPGANIYAIEPGYKGCLNAKKRGVKNVICSSFQNVPDLFNTIDGVGLFDVIEHIQDDVAFMKELAQKCNSETRVYLTVPAFNNLWSQSDDFAGHFRRYTIPMLKELALNSGWHFEFGSYFFSYLPAPSYLMRHLPYKKGKRNSEEEQLKKEKTEHKLSGPVKGIFNIFNRIEISILRHTAIPLGGSCIGVFKKAQ